MGLPVVTVASGGLPIVESTVGGTPVTEAANGYGVAVTKVTGGKPGLPVVFETIGVGPGFATWNPSDKSPSVVLSGGNLTATSNADATFGGVRGTTATSSGKVYFEITHTTTNFADTFIGVAPASKVLNQSSGSFCAVVDCWGGNMFVNSLSNSGSIGDFVSGDVLCVALDLTNKRVWFRRNNGNWNNSGTANPATNIGGLDVSSLFTGISAYPYLCIGHTSKTATLNTGASTFAQTLPGGFVAWSA